MNCNLNRTLVLLGAGIIFQPQVWAAEIDDRSASSVSALSAEELAQVSPEHHKALLAELKAEEELCEKAIAVTYLSHQDFKERTMRSRAVVRTGECTPYANVIFQAGVVF